MPGSKTHAEKIPVESGPRILFFSGGTALRETAGALAQYTRRSTHLITPFDSGGSSQALRRAFDMPAVGDLRARVMALADRKAEGSAGLHVFFSRRLPERGEKKELLEDLLAWLAKESSLLPGVRDRDKAIIAEDLGWFVQNMPEDFSLAGANVGNLFLAACFLRSGRRLRPAVRLFSRLMRARGAVLPVVEASAHLAVRLESGRVIVGQHNFTGKPDQLGASRLDSPIAACWTTASEYSAEALPLAISPHIARRIKEAEALCYPVGSFYSSVLCNLLPAGVGRAVAQNTGPKIFVPNLGSDPELLGHTVQLQVERLLAPLLADAPGSRPKDMLTAVLADAQNGLYPGGLPVNWLHKQGIALVDAPLVRAKSAPLADADMLAKALAEHALQTARPGV